MSLDPPIQTQDHDGLILATRLREARTVLRLTQEDVAGAVGVPRSAVSDIENGKRAVTGLELRRFARLYRRPIGWFLGEEGPPLDDDLLAATSTLADRDREQVLAFARFLTHQVVTR